MRVSLPFRQPDPLVVRSNGWKAGLIMNWNLLLWDFLVFAFWSYPGMKAKLQHSQCLKMPIAHLGTLSQGGATSSRNRIQVAWPASPVFSFYEAGEVNRTVTFSFNRRGLLWRGWAVRVVLGNTWALESQLSWNPVIFMSCVVVSQLLNLSEPQFHLLMVFRMMYKSPYFPTSHMREAFIVVINGWREVWGSLKACPSLNAICWHLDLPHLSLALQ